MVNTIFTSQEYRFQYFFQDQESLEEFGKLENSEEYSVLMINDQIPIYGKDRQIIYEDVDEKLKSLEPETLDSSDQIISIYEFDEEMYVQHLPSEKFYQVVALSVEQYRFGKL
jgi:hypothetical protein